MSVGFNRLLGSLYGSKQSQYIASLLGCGNGSSSGIAHLALRNLDVINVGQSLNEGQTEVVHFVPVVAGLVERTVSVTTDSTDGGSAVGHIELHRTFGKHTCGST